MARVGSAVESFRLRRGGGRRGGMRLRGGRAWGGRERKRGEREFACMCVCAGYAMCVCAVWMCAVWFAAGRVRTYYYYSSRRRRYPALVLLSGPPSQPTRRRTWTWTWFRWKLGSGTATVPQGEGEEILFAGGSAVQAWDGARRAQRATGEGGEGTRRAERRTAEQEDVPKGGGRCAGRQAVRQQGSTQLSSSSWCRRRCSPTHPLPSQIPSNTLQWANSIAHSHSVQSLLSHARHAARPLVDLSTRPLCCCSVPLPQPVASS